MATKKMMIDDRIIAGRLFHFHSAHADKRNAEKDARWLREHGNLARVLSMSPWKRNYPDPTVRYAVYTAYRQVKPRRWR